MQQVRKRNGSIVDFVPEKITIAMQKAFAANEYPIAEDLLRRMTEKTILALDEKYGGEVVSVEDVQDRVELTLMQEGYLEVAKSYIIYRYKHSKIREEKQKEIVKKAEENTLLVTKRNGSKESFSEEKVLKTLSRFTRGYDSEIDKDAIITQLKFSLYENISTAEISRALIMVVRSMIEVDPAYSKVAARMLLERNYEEVFGEVVSKEKLEEEHRRVFVRNIKEGVKAGKFDERMLSFDLEKLGESFILENDQLFEYMGLEILTSRYLLEDPETKVALETPQMLWMRIAMGTALIEKDSERNGVALEFYDVMSNFYYTPGGRTLFQAGVPKAQLSNCFINVVPDSLDLIFKSFSDNAQYLKWSGGTGTSWTPVRSTGSFIKGTGVGSQGIVPFLKIANDVNVAINRSGKRRGAGCIYLETWHLDIEDFLELRKNTGDERRRTHDIDTANWVPDLFMKRVRANETWTLFSPHETPDLHETYGRDFERRYVAYEKMVDEGKIKLWKKIPAADLWKKMLAMLFETGHPWITWKDPCNVRSPQDHVGVVHSSNLCTEITLNTKADETAVCNIGSVNFSRFINNGSFDRETVSRVVRAAVRMLDNIIDINYYPTEDAKRSNMAHRPVGLGIRGYHDALYKLNIPFDSPEALNFADESMEILAYHTILSSSELAKERGTYSTYKGSKWDRGILPQDTLSLLEEERGEAITIHKGGKLDWSEVRSHIKKYGMRNSNTMAIAPTASTANLVGCIPCVEPIYKNIYVKSNKEGDFVVVNKYLIEDLKKYNLWNKEMLETLKYYDGSIQSIPEIPGELKRKYKEAFEIESHWLIEAAARRAKWIDQSQSINIFFRGTSGKDLSDIYFSAWQMGLKTTYYLRTLGASQVEKSTVSTASFGSTHTRTFTSETAQTMESASAPSTTSTPSINAASAVLSTVSIPSRRDNIIYVTTKDDESANCESCQA